MIAIHDSNAGFHPRWIEYCLKQNIPFKLVNCYKNDIIKQLVGCDALMWHFSQSNALDIIVAKELVSSLEHNGMRVFPNFNTSWHFDDKLGQKFLLELLGVPFVDTFVFLNKSEALDWALNTEYPKVFKLRGGAGSANVKLVKSASQARTLIKVAFGKGFRQYDKIANLRERWRKYKIGKASKYDIVKGVLRLFREPDFSKTIGNERGYIYFQEFIPNNDHDIRVIVIGNKAFAIKRMVRKNDFRASGSGHILYEKEHFVDEIIRLSFQINDKVKSQSLAIDYIFDMEIPKVVEISYGFVKEVYDPCVGYWDRNLHWHEGQFNPYGWMVEDLLRTF